MKLYALLMLSIVAFGAAKCHAAEDPATCLAKTIYYEAASEPYAGKVAVGQVVLNRARTVDRVCGVVYARRVTPSGKKIAAFSWTLGRAWRAPFDQTVYSRCEQIAERMLEGHLRSYLIGGRVAYYHAVYVHPSWHKQFVAQIGHHLFYRDN